MLAADELEQALRTLGEVLENRGLRYEVAIIGGGALALAGLIDRPTKDVDIVALLEHGILRDPIPLPQPLAEAVADVARVQNLDDRWLNSEAGAMMRFGLPEGFLPRCRRRELHGLTVFIASRFDQIHFKLAASADDKPGGRHHRDLQRLSPTREELIEAARWTRTHDPSEGFALMLAQILASFGVTEP